MGLLQRGSRTKGEKRGSRKYSKEGSGGEREENYYLDCGKSVIKRKVPKKSERR